MVSVRQYFNEHIVEKNTDLVEAMLYYNRVYGRPESIMKRGYLVLKLCFKYNVLKHNYNPLQDKYNKLYKNEYPESYQNQREQLEYISKQMGDNEYVVCDVWNVLISSALNKEQLLSLAEVKTGIIGFSDTFKLNEKLEIEQQEKICDVLLDFIVINEEIRDVLNKANTLGKQVYVYNNSKISDDIIEKILKRVECKFQIAHSLDKGLHITNECKEKQDIHYKNVNVLGESYRPYFYPNIVTAFYNQLVNMKLHSGKNVKSIFYEYGYTSGGILTCGFCQFLGELAKKEQIDKFLFVARDGDVMYQVYKKYFNNVDSSYLVFSRFASYELIFEDFPEEYIDKNIKPRIDRKNSDNSIKKITSECGLECILQFLYEENLNEEEVLTDSNYIAFRNIILRHKEEIQQVFKETCRAAKQYFMEELQGKKKVCIVDLGWHGKSIVYLKHLCEKKYSWSGEILGALVGASESQLVQSYIRTGLIYTYAFENEYWRNLGPYCGKHMDYKECICLEELFSSSNDTLLRYKINQDGKTDFIYGKKNKNKRTIEEIHQGILDFSKQFMPVINKYNLHITARDAYTPTDALMENREYVNLMYEKYDEEVNAINGF